MKLYSITLLIIALSIHITLIAISKHKKKQPTAQQTNLQALINH